MFKAMLPEDFEKHPRARALRITADRPFELSDLPRMASAFLNRNVYVISFLPQPVASTELYEAVTVRFLVPYRSRSAMCLKKLLRSIEQELTGCRVEQCGVGMDAT